MHWFVTYTKTDKDGTTVHNEIIDTYPIIWMVNQNNDMTSTVVTTILFFKETHMNITL